MDLNNRIDLYINEMDVSSIKSEVSKILKTLINMPSNKVKSVMKKHLDNFIAYFKKRHLDKEVIQILNKSLGTNFNKLEDLKVSNTANESVINEDFGHFWEFVKDQAFPTLSFYPALTVWMQLDKLITGNPDFSLRISILYSVLWFLLVSGKFVGLWKRWKKEHPEEYEREGAKKNPFSINKKKKKGKKEYGMQGILV